MRITYPAGRNVVLTSPAGEEYDAREEVIRRPWDLYDLPYNNLRCLWRLSWGDYYLFGRFLINAGSGSYSRVAPTDLTSESTASWFGKPYLKLITGTTAGSNIAANITVFIKIPAGKKIYLYAVFTPTGGGTGDSVRFELLHWTGGKEYVAGVRWLKGTGWQARVDGGYQNIPNTPTTWYPQFHYTMLFSVVATIRLDKLYITTDEYDLSDRTMWGFGGGGEYLLISFGCNTATGTATGLQLYEAAVFVEK